MNIFKALSMGKGRLNEENMSAMLGYLLSPRQPHGLGDLFLKRFLSTLNNFGGCKGRFGSVLDTKYPLEAEVLLEEPYSHLGKKWFVDLVIQIYTKASPLNDKNEIHRIIIENKIHPQSSNSIQLRSEFLAVLEDLKSQQAQNTTDITMVFLTPDITIGPLQSEFNALLDDDLENHRKAWLKWTGDSSIISIIRSVLKDESIGDIDPISDYMRHTLKAFIRHVLDSQEELKNPSTIKSNDPGEIKEFVLARMDDVLYRIEQYDSSTIRVYNLETQENEVALPMLKRINIELQLGLDTHFSRGQAKNTRHLGKEIIRSLKEQGKAESNPST
ncbi:PD-(D/E)XK nuclease family protein [Paenibacillus albidus]|uniref:PD-(D/E)XK nuclease family protein n=1 Tax=Paenibacillus albidus TaxID=2041023 RepID=UPI001BE63578|nr:PD-(D/E)XK nuclease family protein [Paenibacillus albidus]MBT2289305.1 PD-(D/E)XK nuclease family protein [Paenibacillus albidus]